MGSILNFHSCDRPVLASDAANGSINNAQRIHRLYVNLFEMKSHKQLDGFSTHIVFEMMAISRYVYFVRLFAFLSFFLFVAPNI